MKNNTKQKRRLSGVGKAIMAVLVMVAFMMSIAPYASAQDDAQDVAYVDGLPCKADEVLVKYSASQSAAEIAYALDSCGSDMAQALPDDMVVADVPAGQTVEGFIEALDETPGVEYAQPNYIYTLETTSVNDPMSLNGVQWYLNQIGVYDAWDTTMGTAAIRVAVLDSGIDVDHEDLLSRIYAQTDAVDDDDNADDDYGHGTHVAGIIAASANNGVGIAGIAPHCELVIVDVFSQNAEGKMVALTSDCIEGINYAMTQGVRVINMSIGGYGDDTMFKAAIETATAAEIVCVAAAGNDNTTSAHYPSDYDACIGVVSVSDQDIRSSFSNYGSAKDICAPGESIASTYYDGGYRYMSGTSMATPVVSGVAALLLSVNPGLTVSEVKDILYTTAVDLGSEGKDNVYGNGRIDAALAVAEAAGSTTALDVRLNMRAVSMGVGDETTLTEQILPTTTADKTVSWSSSETSVATVSGGVVTAVGSGTATITVTTNDGSLTDTCEVSVVAPVQSVSISRSTADINEGDTLTLTATVLPEDATDKTVSWSSSKTSVATVSGGVVSGVSPGTATITVTTNDGGHKATCTVNVAAVNIASGVYTISQTANTLCGVAKNTSVSQLKSNLSNDSDKVSVYKSDGTLYTGSAVATGMSVKLKNGGATVDELTIIVEGDCNGDGNISITDYTLVRLHILRLKTLGKWPAAAADINGDGNISITDYTLVRLDILGLKNIH